MSVLRVALAAFVLVWILGPYALRSAVPIWLVFLIALGLELHFFVGALAQAPAPPPDRGPQLIDRERYGYTDELDDPLLVHEEDEELWVPYSGERDEEVERLSAEAPAPRKAEAGAAAVALRERSRFWLPVRRFLVGLGVIGALTLILWIAESRTGWDALDPDTRAEAAARFSDEASRIAAKPVTIQCDEAGDRVGVVQHADGAAAVGGDLAFLTPQRCLDLYRLAFKGEVRSSQTARALAVLAHEAWHLRGVRDEGTTECYALQAGVELGQRLGLSKETAWQMMRQQLAENAGHSRANPEYLVSPDCREGGRLDLNSGLARFP